MAAGNILQAAASIGARDVKKVTVSSIEKNSNSFTAVPGDNDFAGLMSAKNSIAVPVNTVHQTGSAYLPGCDVINIWTHIRNQKSPFTGRIVFRTYRDFIFPFHSFW